MELPKETKHFLANDIPLEKGLFLRTITEKATGKRKDYVTLSMHEVKQYAQQLAEMLGEKLPKDKPLFLASLWRGGAPVHYVIEEVFQEKNIPVFEHYSIRSKAYHNDKVDEKGIENFIPQHLWQIIRAKKGEVTLVTIDDIFDTGLSVQAYENTLQYLLRKNYTEPIIATLFQKPGKNQTKKKPDYFITTVPDHAWVIFPHEIIPVLPDHFSKPQKKEMYQERVKELNLLLKGNAFVEALTTATMPQEYEEDSKVIYEALAQAPRIKALIQENPKKNVYLISNNDGRLPGMVIQEYLTYKGIENYHTGIMQSIDQQRFYGIEEVLKKIMRSPPEQEHLLLLIPGKKNNIHNLLQQLDQHLGKDRESCTVYACDIRKGTIKEYK